MLSKPVFFAIDPFARSCWLFIRDLHLIEFRCGFYYHSYSLDYPSPHTPHSVLSFSNTGTAVLCIKNCCCLSEKVHFWWFWLSSCRILFIFSLSLFLFCELELRSSQKFISEIFNHLRYHISDDQITHIYNERKCLHQLYGEWIRTSKCEIFSFYLSLCFRSIFFFLWWYASFWNTVISLMVFFSQ